ncbi:MAG: YceI family protein [Flavobacteriales bacterium]
MKHTLLLLSIAASSMLMSACGGANTSADEHASEQDATNTSAESSSWTIDTENSSIRWEGGTSGAMVYSHFGTINFKEGALSATGDKISGGSFVVDLSTINPQDNGYSEEHPASDLVGHLGSPDFFDIANHPTASFEVISSEGNDVNGSLTVRGITNPETIHVETMEMNPDGTMTAKGKLVFDRQKYNVKWAHYVQDVILSDNITLDFSIVAKKKG